MSTSSASSVAISSGAAAVAALVARYPSLSVQSPTSRSLALHTVLRATTTETTLFVHTADQLLRQLVEHALSGLPVREKVIQTPTRADFVGCELTREVVGVSIVRAGESMEAALRSILLGVRIGKILIQRDETVAEKPAKFYYSKLPPAIGACQVLLLDPMLASGGSAICAIQHLISVGVPLEQITFVCLISSPEGLAALYAAFPTLAISTGCIDERIDERKYIVPGIGDFGDRYFGTVEPQTEHESAAFTTANATVQQ